MNNQLEKFRESIKALEESEFFHKGMIHLKDLLQTHFLIELVNNSLLLLNTTENYYPKHSSMNHWHILSTSLFSLSLVKIKNESQNKYINSSFYDKIIVPLTEDVSYSHYIQKDPHPTDQLDTQKKLIPVAIKQQLKIAEPFAIKKHETIFSYHGQLNETSIFLSFSCKKSASYSWEYDAKTLIPLRLVTNVSQSARLEHTCKLLGELGISNSLPNLFRFLKNPYHNVRWEAARAIMAIDFNKGLEALTILEKDNHPDIRSSVENALQQIATLNLS